MSNVTIDEQGNLKSWLDYIENLNPDKIELGLDRVKTVLSRLELGIYDSIPVIEIAGTNGKGSTAALIAGALDRNGVVTGLYTSPHLIDFNERIAVGGQKIDDQTLCKAFALVHSKSKDIKLTYFEYTTLAALVCFSIKKVQAVVLEVGLGGRLDAVNILDADISVITSVGLDHTHILGNSLKKIAYEKAGIIKENSQVVVGRMSNEALQEILKVAKEKQAKLYYEGVDFAASFDNGFEYAEKKATFVVAYKYPRPSVPECCAPIAIKVLNLLRESGLKLRNDLIADAVSKVSLPGRMQCISIEPLVYLDVAHNPPAAEHLVGVLEKKYRAGRRFAVIGMLRDKDIESVIRIIKDSFDGFYVASLHTSRGESFTRIYKALVSCGVKKDLIKSFDNVENAVTEAVVDADKIDEIFVLGSFVTVTEAINVFSKNKKIK